MHLNKASAIWIIAHVAAELGEDEDWLFDVIGEMFRLLNGMNALS